MFAILPLDSSSVMRFEALAPFDVRHVLRDLGAHGRVHAIGATLLGRPIGLALAVQGWATAGAFGGAAPEAGSARILAIAVARAYRRIGVARALLRTLEASLAAQGVRSVDCNYAIATSDGLIAAEAMFRAAGWAASELTMLQCRADHALLAAPIMRDQLVLPPEYEIVDWVDLPADDRERIAERQRVSPWFPETLNPFHFEAELEILNSLALRYQGEVVGWLITRRTSSTTMYYRCLFVREDLARLGRGLALIAEAVRRHALLVGSRYGYGEWSTPASLPAMVRFIRRHLVPHGATVIEQRVVRTTLPATVAPAVLVRPARRPAVRQPVLSRSECEETLTLVRDAHALWTARFDTLPFHTLGAVAFLDAWESKAPYVRAATRANARLVERFAWLYERLHAALANMLGQPVVQRAGWATPAFHVWTHTRGAELNLAPIRCDLSHQFLEPGVAYERRPISFSLCIEQASEGDGLTFWDLWYEEAVGLDTEEKARLLEAVPRSFESFVRGSVLAYAADQYHQAAPLPRDPAGSARVTVEGQAIFVDGIWHVYG